MKRIFLLLGAAALVAAMVVASALPALATPKALAGCKGIENAIAKQMAHGKTPSTGLMAQAAAHGCSTTTAPPPTTTT